MSVTSGSSSHLMAITPIPPAYWGAFDEVFSHSSLCLTSNYQSAFRCLGLAQISPNLQLPPKRIPCFRPAAILSVDDCCLRVFSSLLLKALFRFLISADNAANFKRISWRTPCCLHELGHTSVPVWFISSIIEGGVFFLLRNTGCVLFRSPKRR